MKRSIKRHARHGGTTEVPPAIRRSEGYAERSTSKYPGLSQGRLRSFALGVGP
jgi:hypothetical protein